MIDKIDTTMRVSAIDVDGCVIYDRDSEPVSRPMNNVEHEVVSKINEIVDKFNEVFPI